MIQLTIGITLYRDKKNYKLRTQFIKKAINSILSQKYSENIFLIIGNDSPFFPFYLNQVGIKSNKNIRIINRKLNLGEEKNMNDLLSRTKTKWFMWLADDDYLNNNFFNYINKIKDLNKYTAVYSNYYRITKKNKSKKKINKTISINKLDLNKFHNLFLSRKINLIGTYGVMKKKFLMKIKGIKKLGNSYGPYSDLLVPLKLANHGEIGYIEEKLVNFRIHENSLSINSDYPAYYSAKKDFLNEYKYFKKYISRKEFSNNIYLFNTWFISSIFEVLKRDHSKSIISKILIMGNINKNVFINLDLKNYFFIILKILRYIFKLI